MPYYPGAGPTWSNQFYKTRQIPYPVPLPFTYTNNFEGIPAGNALSTANSGGVSGRAFDAVNTGTGSAVSDSTYVAHGVTAMKLSTSASSANTFRWNSFGGQYILWFRLNFNTTALPASNVRILQGQTNNNNPQLCAALQFTTLGKFSWINAPGSTVVTTINTVSLGQWMRLEGLIYGNATAGVVELKIFNNIESNTPLETINGTTNTFDQMTAFLFGTNIGIANYGPIWLDDIVLTNQGYPGPPSFPAPYPPAESFPGQTWQKNYQHKQLTYTSVFDMYVGPALGSVNVAGTSGNTATVSQSISPPNVSVSGQTDNTILEVVTGTSAGISVSSPSDNIITELISGSASSVNSAGMAGSLLANILGSASSVNIAGIAGGVEEDIIGAATSVTISGIAGTITEIVPGSTSTINVIATPGTLVQPPVNLLGPPSTVIIMSPSGTVTLEPVGTWWRVYPAYRSYPA